MSWFSGSIILIGVWTLNPVFFPATGNSCTILSPGVLVTKGLINWGDKNDDKAPKYMDAGS